MTREEFIKRIDALREEMKAVRQEYKDSMPVKAGQLVDINGRLLWLDAYRIEGYSIQPSLYGITKTRKPAKYEGMVYVDDWKSMKPAYT